ncbi:MAG TPA: TetR/AcrR family transcriptional regulator [Nocardioides sp.]|uniref:TetR/AcrR family transcriptional regulator n=1 Tax=Nocardioides sp. TaxID=35761 RepID=UPI002F3F3BF3
MTQERTTGRVAQRRRTRRAILDATAGLLRTGAEPSVSEIAAAADVSRRTVYLYYPTLDQLVLDATIGTLNVDVDAALAAQASDDPHERLRTLVTETFATMESSLPLGRKLIRLTVDAPPPAGGGPRRGHRRVGWIEWAVEPCRERLAREDYEDLVSGLALVIGWEAFIVLLDVRGLSADAARRLTLRTAEAILDAALAS